MRNVEVGYSDIYPANGIVVDINSDMMYLVSRINDISTIQKDAILEYQDPVVRSVWKKEKKLKGYKETCNYSVSEWWLCIEIPQDAYLNPNTYKLPPNFRTEYHKIFIVNNALVGSGVQQIYNKEILCHD